MRTPDFWRTKNWRSTLLLPVSLLYRFGSWMDRETTKPKTTSIPVVSVGNVTAGGTGKTPVTLALIPLLKTTGFIPHILTRGYKSKYSAMAHRVESTDAPEMVGDEAVLLAKAAPTWVGRDRFDSSQHAAEAGASVVVCDDAHQHYVLAKTLSFIVIDGPFGFGNERLLPAGPLREPLERALSRADAIVLIGADVHQLRPRFMLPVFEASLVPDAPANLLDHIYVAFAGIGRPQKFFDTLLDLGAALVVTHSFPDHHTYLRAEIEGLLAQAAAQNAKLITTEKDAVKLPADLREAIVVLPVRLEFAHPNEIETFLRLQLT